jgi:uncharacterized protein YdeI (YjbR/CyaY-like superfamily)
MKNPKIDVIIESAQPFAQPILMHIRDLVHEVCPEVEETIKWGMPHFDFSGASMCGMGAFKQHCSLFFPKASLMKDGFGYLGDVGQEGMGNFGKIGALSELPPDGALKDYMYQAMELNRKGIKVKKVKKEIVVPELPDDFRDAMQEDMSVFEQFESMAPSHRKEYIEWITEAKRPETRANRIITAVEWISQGKGRNWKYM